MNDYIRLRSGQQLPRTIADYDRGRPDIVSRTLKAVCYAPFLSMDFDATGAVRLCNHSHSFVAQLTPVSSVLEIWRSQAYQRYRAEMRDYILDDNNCHHCVRQCAAGPDTHVFATEQFDKSAGDDPNPLYPKRLIFRLNSTCNLSCVMCDGITSSRIRRERDHLPLMPSMYGERFFADMEEMLPHVEHIEFYGGEPFLVKEHVRIFEILTRLKAPCTIYVNTNAVSFHPKAKQFLETLNFKTVAVSMDAVEPELHGEIRGGLKSDLFFENVRYLLELRKRRGVEVMLNVTEHRKNWFELPQVFRFAEKHQMYLHVNTCIHPHNVTLYTLPSDELRYVQDFLEGERRALLREYPRFSNLSSYDSLLSLVRGELESRSAEWLPAITNLNLASDGWLGAPRPGNAPFDTPARVRAEIERILRSVRRSSGVRLLREMRSRVERRIEDTAWASVAADIDRAVAALVAPSAETPPIGRLRVSDDDRIAALFRQAPWSSAPISSDAGGFPAGYLLPTESSLLYHLAREGYSGRGVVVDCGAFLGKSAALLAQGLKENRHIGTLPEELVHSYDLFRVRNQHDAAFIKSVSGANLEIGASSRRLFEAHTRRWAETIVAHEGDFLEAEWRDGDVELLFMDICETPALNGHLLQTFFPSLIPGCSVVVQQDYHLPHFPFIHLSLERLADYLEPLATRVDDSYVFRLRRTVPRDVLAEAASVQHLPPERQLALMASAVARLPAGERHFLELARAVLRIQLEGKERASDVLAQLPQRVAPSDADRWQHEREAVERWAAGA